MCPDNAPLRPLQPGRAVGASERPSSVPAPAKRDEGRIIVTARMSLEEEPAASEVPPEGDGDGHGELLPTEGVNQDRSFPAGRPGAPDRGPLRDATLVLEDDPGAAAASLFLSWASASSSSAESPRRCARGPAWPVAARSTPSPPRGARHGRGDTARQVRAEAMRPRPLGQGGLDASQSSGDNRGLRSARPAARNAARPPLRPARSFVVVG
jgi:hypothetical protein